MDGFIFSELCRMVGKDSIYIRNLQRQLDLHILPRDQTYSQCYLIFLEKVVALRAFHIMPEDIRELFDTEKRILKFLHMDALTDSPTWYLDACSGEEEEETHPDRLLLSGSRLGFPIDAPTVQDTLDFGQRDPELFRGVDMGEDVRVVLRKYLLLLQSMKGRIAREKPVLENALQWAKRFLRA